MSELEELCWALDAVVRPLPALAEDLQQRAARLRMLAAEVQRAASRVPGGPDCGRVVHGLYEAAASTAASGHALTAAAEQGRAFVQRTVGGNVGTAGGDQAGPEPTAWPGQRFGLQPSPTASGGINLLPADDRAGQMAAELEGVPGFTDVIIHGNPYSFGSENGPDVTPADLADVVRATPQLVGRPLRLLSCSAGRLDDGAAQQLADEIGQPVMAATDIVHLVGRPGRVRMVVGPNEWTNTGEWRVFYPRTRESGA